MEAGGFETIVRALPAHLPRHPLPEPPAIRERLEAERITIRGCRPGHPVLIRVSYHPRWKALGGEHVYLAGPSMMLVFPRSEEVVLVFGTPGVVRVGQAATVLGWMIVLMAAPPVRRRVWPRILALRRTLAATPPIDGLARPIHRTATWSVSTRRLVLALALTSVVGTVTGLVVFSEPSAHRVYLEAQALFAADRLDEAQPLFARARRLAPLSRFAMLGQYFVSLIDFRRERWTDARAGFQQLAQEFPEGITAAPTLYHLGVSEERLGHQKAAEAAWRQTVQRYPGTDWARLAAEKLGGA